MTGKSALTLLDDLGKLLAFTLWLGAAPWQDARRF